jgi:coatomer protein complex subunit gamma
MKVLPCPRLEYNVSGVCYVIVSCPDDVAEWVGTISPTLKFIVKDCDPNTGEPDSNDG